MMDLAAAFVDPALAFLRSRGADIRFGHRLRAIDYEAGRAMALRFGDDDVQPRCRRGGDRGGAAGGGRRRSCPTSAAPTEFRAIVNAHFKVAPPAGVAPITGVVNGTTEWLFAFDDRLSVTVSSADRLLDVAREELAQTIWHEVARVAGLPEGAALPPWQIVRERRATFAALPSENRKRPPATSRWANLFLAGDWTATGLPATIEGSIRSGFRAAELVAKA